MIVVFDGANKVAFAILTGCAGEHCIHVVGVQIQHHREVVNGLVNLAELVEGTASDLVRAKVPGVDLEQGVAVVHGVVVVALLHV